jgi:predicted transcriptional regulator
MREEKQVPFSIRLDPRTKAALEDLARADDRSLSAYVSRVLRQHVEVAGGADDVARKRGRGGRA